MSPLTITFTLTTPAQLNAVLMALNIDEAVKGATLPMPATLAPVAEKATPKAETKAVEKAVEKVEAKKETAPIVETPAQPEPADPSVTSVTYDDVKKVVLSVSQNKGRDAAVGLLGAFGLSTLKDAKPEQWAEIKIAAEKALA